MAFLCCADYLSALLTIVRSLPMSDAHNALITEFYSAFQRLDAEAMVACYTDDVVFSDPAFGELSGRDAGDMWRMLTTRAKAFSLTFDTVRSDETTGSAHWVATYLFSAPATRWSTTSARGSYFATARFVGTTTISTCGAGRARRWVSRGCCWAGRRR